MLQTLITSKTRIKLLLKFFLNIQNSSYLKKLEAEFADSSNGIRLELNKLEEAGLLVSHSVSNKKVYQANSVNPIYKEIHSLLLKHTGIDQVIDQVLNQLGELQSAYLTGALARGIDAHNIEIMLVGDLNESYLQQLITKAEGLIQKKITYHLYNSYEFQIQKADLLANAHLHLFGEA